MLTERPQPNFHVLVRYNFIKHFGPNKKIYLVIDIGIIFHNISVLIPVFMLINSEQNSDLHKNNNLNIQI